jgi:hypothetical protein
MEVDLDCCNVLVYDRHDRHGVSLCAGCMSVVSSLLRGRATSDRVGAWYEMCTEAGLSVVRQLKRKYCVACGEEKGGESASRNVEVNQISFYVRRVCNLVVCEAMQLNESLQKVPANCAGQRREVDASINAPERQTMPPTTTH